MTASPNSTPPNSWFFLLAGFSTLAVAGMLTAVVLFRYLNDRPIDLVPHTEYLAERTYDVLVNNRIPPSNISRGDESIETSSTAHWHSESFTVDVPPTLSAEGLVDVLRREMAQRKAYVKETGTGDGLRRVELAFSGQPFAYMELRGGREAKSGPRDLSANTKDLASEVREILERSLDPGISINRRIPEQRQSDSAIWSYTKMSLRAPSDEAFPDVVSILRGALDDEAVSVDPLPETAEARGASVSYEGYAAVEVVLAASETEPTTPDVELPVVPLSPDMEEPALFNEELPDLDGLAPGSEASGDSELPLESDGLAPEMLGPMSNGRPMGNPDEPEVAIIVDDGGNNSFVDSAFLELDTGLTFAILPFTPHAKALAEKAAERGFEVMLHMPMESTNGNVTHPGIVLTAMASAEIEQKTVEALESVPGVRGINNHTGSFFTESREALEPVFDVLLERDLFFVDSRTSAESVAPALAASMNLPVAVRDVFLDNESDYNYIAGQFEELAAKAKKRGYAIGICHFRAETYDALVQLLPSLEAEGITLVHVSELVY